MSEKRVYTQIQDIKMILEHTSRITLTGYALLDEEEDLLREVKEKAVELRDSIIASQYRMGVSTSAIAEEWGLSTSRISQIRKKANGPDDE